MSGAGAICASAVALICGVGAAAMAASDSESVTALRWFEPWIEIDTQALRELEKGSVIAKTLPADGSEIAVFIAGAIDVDPAVFVDAVRDTERLWMSEQVPRVRRFSSPPRLQDLEHLRLAADDIEAIRRCRPGDCEVKLTAAEMRRLQATHSVEREFRKVVLDRVLEYQATGFRTTGDFHDHAMPVDPLTATSGLLLRSPWLTEDAPRLAAYMEDFPSTKLPGSDSFLYWLETEYAFKPTVRVVHVVIGRSAQPSATAPDVLVVSRQVYASHYLNGSLSLTALLGGRNGSRQYLAYATRAHVDGMRGWLSGLRRLLIERGVRRRGAAAFEEQRRRIESWMQLTTGDRIRRGAALQRLSGERDLNAVVHP